ncbi:hypothetical protein [Paenarthrobacter sp. NPDC058040]|uniref:hypothetical protein n=1 Tax=unclassified Paenarthrobacter TaxID=2634190 RepID=UPI0036DDFFD2
MQLLKWEDELILRAGGVVLALLGAVLTSPHGWKRLLFLIKFWLKSRVVIVQMWLSQHLRFVRAPSTTASVASIVSANRELTMRGTAQFVIPQDATTEAKIALLEVALRNLQNTVNSDFSHVENKLSEVASLVRDATERTTELHTRILTTQDEAASIGAAGIPVIAFGILLSGIPRELAICPVVGWAVLAGSVFLGYAMTRKTIKDGAWTKKGSQT